MTAAEKPGPPTRYDVFVTIDGVETQIFDNYPARSEAEAIFLARKWYGLTKPAPESDSAYRVVESTQ